MSIERTCAGSEFQTDGEETEKERAACIHKVSILGRRQNSIANEDEQFIRSYTIKQIRQVTVGEQDQQWTFIKTHKENFKLQLDKNYKLQTTNSPY